MSSSSSDAKRAFSAISNITACLSASRSAPAAAGVASSEQTSSADPDDSGDVTLCRCMCVSVWLTWLLTVAAGLGMRVTTGRV